MAKGQKPESTELLSLFKRGQTSVDPHQLTLITDPKDPMYDKRILLPVTDEDALNIAAAGFVQPISVRLRGKEAVVVDGVQRTKRAIIINAVTGQHAYKGAVQSIRDAILRLSDAESGIGKRIIQLCPKGVKIPISVYRGNEQDSFFAKVSANEYRQGDPLAERARKAQQMSRHGHNEEEIALAFNGVHVQTVKRWLVMDVDREPGAKKPRTKKTKPTAKRIELALTKFEDWNGTERETSILNWVLGKKTLEQITKDFPELAVIAEKSAT